MKKKLDEIERLNKKIEKLNKTIVARERSILSINEFSDLLNLLSGSDKTAIHSMYLGFSAESIGADKVVFYYYDEASKLLYPNFIMVYKNRKLMPYDFYSELKNLSIKLGEDACGYAAETETPLLLSNLSSEKSKDIYKGLVDKKIKIKFKSAIDIPLIIKDKLFGVLEVSTKRYTLSNIEFSVLRIITNLVTNIMEKTTLYNWAITDNLTQLYNFHFFQLALDQELTRIKRYPQPLSLIMLDIDNFKSINDTYGHQVGNIVLKRLAKVIRESLRKNIDLPVRFGGDEFIIILPHTNKNGAFTFANRILEKIRSISIKNNDNEIKFSVSIGVRTIESKDLNDKTDILAEVDSALYKAKNNGKNQIQVYSEIEK